MTASIGRALGTSSVADVTPSVNPLMYTVRLAFGEPIFGTRRLLVWNYVEQFAALNDAVLQGKVEGEGPTLAFHIAIKRRTGIPNKKVPW